MEMTRQASRSLVRPTSADISVLLILIVLVRVNTQCPQCTGQFIKIINATTGECIRCFPCPRCDDAHTSSVPCGTTAPYGTHITCVLIQPDPVSSAQTHTATLLTISSPSKLVVAAITSITSISATSSSASFSSSINQEASKKKEDERALPLDEWKKHTIVYLTGGVFLVVVLFLIVCRILNRKTEIQLHARPENPERCPASWIQPIPAVPLDLQDNGTCNINCATNTVMYTHQNGNAAEMGGGSRRSQPGVAHPSLLFDTAAVKVVQPPTQSVPHPSCPRPLVDIAGSGPLTGGTEQQTPVSWSALPQMQKYQTKVLMLPFSLLNKICLTLDAPRPDGNDVRMLAEKCGISLSDLALLKQAAITQSPDNVCCNALTYFVLKSKKALITVGEFVNIMKDIERDDIVSLINGWR